MERPPSRVLVRLTPGLFADTLTIALRAADCEVVVQSPTEPAAEGHFDVTIESGDASSVAVVLPADPLAQDRRTIVLPDAERGTATLTDQRGSRELATIGEIIEVCRLRP